MPKDPTAAVPPGKRLPTQPDDIGRVAPDFSDRRHFNTFVIRPEYRVSLRLGAVEDLFADPPDTARGRLARLQVLGMFYLPMGHKDLTAARLTDPTNDFNFGQYCAWVKDKTFGGADPDVAIQDRLRSWVVGSGALPEPAADPKAPKPENFRKLHIPGGHTYMQSFSALVNPLDDPAYPNTAFNSDRYPIESLYYRDNPVLGRVPLVALVEKYDMDAGEWKPVKDAWVYLELVPPYDLPDFDPAAPILDQFNRPPIRSWNTLKLLGGGPKKLIDAKEKYKLNSKDPQGRNAHADFGGKRGHGSLADSTDVADADAAKSLFDLASVKGFNAQHGGARAAYTHADYKVPVASDDNTRLHAVKVQTNAEGEAGVVFMPSRCGGDTYRFRVSIGPDTLKGKPDAFNAVALETGTLVNWRSMRVSQYLRQPADSVAAEIITDWGAQPYGYDEGLLQFYAGCQSLDTVKNEITGFIGLNDPHITDLGDGKKIYDGFIQQFAKAFCEVEFDPGADAPANISQAKWAAARIAGAAAVKTESINRSAEIDTDVLFYIDTPGVTAATALTHMPMRTAVAYNDALAAKSSALTDMVVGADGTPDATERTLLDDLLWGFGFGAFMNSLTGCGTLPGVSIVDGGFGCGWQLPGAHVAQNTGVAMNYRGVYVWKGKHTYPAHNAMRTKPGPGLTYDYTCNVCHEFGHDHYRPHAVGHDKGGGDGGGADKVHHDNTNDTTCVMSYKTCEGQFCAKCLFAMRGWDMHKF